MKFLSEKELENLSTVRLLAYKNKLMAVPEAPNWGDTIISRNINKSFPEWKTTYDNLKKILSNRENVA